MGGSGGGGGTFNFGPERERLARELQLREDAAIAAFQARLSEVLSEYLTQYNDRDRGLVRERLDAIKSALSGELNGTFDQLFGGSVAKHTYVDGLSDIDCLAIINESDLEGSAPAFALKRMQEILDHATSDAEVTSGRMAVTLNYADGMELQILPVVRGNDGHLRVPSSRTDDWSKINPATFTAVLTKRNEECGGKLVPTIKLAKAVIAGLPAEHKLGGYHVESLAIEAFRDYDGPKTTPSMLPTFFERARTLVLTPMRDRTGQSVHVDQYLGAEHSLARQAVSLSLGRVARQMRTASATESVTQWRSFFGFDE